MKSRLSGVSRATSQRGLTLLELMIAMTISLIVVLAALAALLFAREGFSAVDTASQLRENTRFATELISRVVQQAGFQQVSELAVGANSTGGVIREDALATGNTPTPDIQGYNNALFDNGAPVDNNRDTECAVLDTTCVNGSDVLIVRYEGLNNPNGSADGSVINCAGQAQGSVAYAGGLNTGRATSAFYVDINANTKEPVLMCAVTDSTGAWATTPPSPLIDGVESFQVLYGTDNVTPGVNSAAAPLMNRPTQWLHADQLTVPKDTVGTYANWRRVRAVRIGIVMRSPVTVAGSSSAAPVYPFVASAVLPTTAPDPGVPLNVPADHRLRQSFTFTINLRNSLCGNSSNDPNSC